MHTNEQFPNFNPAGMVTSTQLGVIQAEGVDAGSFLQGQLTHDVLLLPVGQARLAGYCSAKGRLMASFWVLKLSPEKFVLVCHASLLASILKRLSMFVMRAKVKLSDATASYRLTGLLGDGLLKAFPAAANQAPWHVLALNEPGAHLIQLYPSKTFNGWLPRAVLITENAENSPVELAQANLELLSLEAWQLSEVLSGISMVQDLISEAFVPQMLNYESVDGVSFKKGCYPGQEVVARSQFRGTLKRRAYVVSSQAPMMVGQEVFSSNDETQACGMVASAAAFSPDASHSAASYWGIVSMQTSAVDQSLHIGSGQGPQMHVHALPYALLEDI